MATAKGKGPVPQPKASDLLSEPAQPNEPGYSDPALRADYKPAPYSGPDGPSLPGMLPDMPPVSPMQMPTPQVVVPVTVAPVESGPGGLPLLPIPDPATVQCPGVDICGVVEAINVLTGALNGFHTQIASTIASQQSSIALTLNTLQSAVAGKLQNQADKCEDAYAKATKKIRARLAAQMGNCYANCFTLGLEYPTDDMVSYGLETGRCLESCGYRGGVGNLIPQYPQKLKSEPEWSQSIINAPITQNFVAEGYEAPEINVTVNVPPSTEKETVREKEVTRESVAAGKLKAEAIEACPDVPSWLEPIIQGINQSLETGLKMFQSCVGSTDEKTELTYYNLFTGLVTGFAPVPPGGPIPVKPADKTLETPESPKQEHKRPEDIAPDFISPPVWGDVNSCLEAGRFASGSGLRKKTGRVLGFRQMEDGRYSPAWFYDAWTDRDTWYYRAIWGFFEAIDDVLTRGVGLLGKVTRCDMTATGLPVVVRSLLGFADFWSNGALGPLLRGYDYWIAYNCPQELPSAAETNAAFLNGGINAALWECWTKANNQLLHPARKVLFGQRTKAGLHEAMMLWRWGKIDEPSYKRLLRQNGVVTAADRAQLEKASENIPTPADLIRMMVRDVADPAAVEKYSLDAEFEQKFQGDLEAFAAAQGMTKEIFRMHWRAHWEQISNTQAFEMLHRLRPGEVGANVITTEDDIRNLLAINDTLPFWRDRLMAISYHPLTRTDAQRAFMIDALDAAGLKKVFQDEGYTSSDADILVRFAEKQKELRVARLTGTRNIGNIKKQFLAGVVTYDEFVEVVKARVPAGPKQDAMLTDAVVDQKIAERVEKMRCVKSFFDTGRTDREDTRKNIMSTGLPLGDANKLIDRWEVCRTPRRKLGTAAQICKWKSLALIDTEEQIRRLVNLGWTPADAKLVADECEKGLSEKKAAKLLAELNKKEKARLAKETADRKEQARIDREAAAASRRSPARPALNGQPVEEPDQFRRGRFD